MMANGDGYYMTLISIQFEVWWKCKSQYTQLCSCQAVLGGLITLVYPTVCQLFDSPIFRTKFANRTADLMNSAFKPILFILLSIHYLI